MWADTDILGLVQSNTIYIYIYYPICEEHDSRYRMNLQFQSQMLYSLGHALYLAQTLAAVQHILYLNKIPLMCID